MNNRPHAYTSVTDLPLPSLLRRDDRKRASISTLTFHMPAWPLLLADFRPGRLHMDFVATADLFTQEARRLSKDAWRSCKPLPPRLRASCAKMRLRHGMDVKCDCP
jgi:hypothetical protein